MTAAIAGAVKAPFSFMMGLSNNVAHIIEYAAIGGIVIVFIVLGIYFFREHEKSGNGKQGRSKGRKR